MFSNPKRIIDSLSIIPGMKIADIGSGSGEYSLPLAEATGSSGKVYAIDIQKDLLERLKKAADERGIMNIDILWGDVDEDGGTGLKDNSVDMSIAPNILFQVEKPESLAKEIGRITKPNGKVVLIDWSDSFGGLGPRKESIFSKEKALTVFSGFEKVSEIEAGDHHWGIILKKV
ncbi:MAG: class I SAM-dependent methyltransferase [Candidatus Pacebacteria bacterium]|nr:class I SAM-dependent methyltransferase [Candidatus Paceibacterota bacterium]